MATSQANEPKKRKRGIGDEEMSQTIAREDYREDVDSDTDFDDDNDEGENNINDKYDLSSEDPPDHPAYDQVLEEVMTAFTRLIVEFAKISRTRASGSETLQNVQMNAQALCERPKPTPPTFAVIGVRASGKSELLNQVTGLEHDLMRTGSLEATTYVATVLQSPFPEQKRKFGVLINFKTEEMCRAGLEDLVAQAATHGSVPSDDANDDAMYESIVYGHEAVDTLTCMFRQRPGFRNLDETRRTLAGTRKTFKDEPSSNATSKDALLERMLRWLIERLPDASSLYFETDYAVRDHDMDPSMIDVDSLLRKYTTGNVDDGEEVYWPMVQEVCVGIKDSRTLELIRVVDLPGQYDINPIRNSAAENYIRECQGLWVVAEANGAIDNQALHMTVSKLAGRFPDRLIVILTKTDIVDEGVLKRLRDDGVDMTEHDLLDERVRSLRGQLAKADQQLGKRKISAKKYEQVLLRRKDLQLELNEAKHMLFAHRVELRSDTVKEKVRPKLERYLPRGETLPILATSAKHYRAHAGTGERCFPLMSIEMTQIPVLRHMAYTIAGPARFRTFIQYLESMAIFLIGMRKWTEGCSSNDDAELASIAQNLHEDSEFTFAALIKSREEIIQAKVLRLLRARTEESRRKAAEELEAICKWKPQSFYSFFKKHGRHVTPKQGAHSWTENFLRSQTNHILDPAWHEMVVALDSLLGEITSSVTAQFDRTLSEMLQSQASARSDTTTIGRHFKTLQSAFSRDCLTVAEKYKERLLTIKMDATKDSARNYLSIAMEPVYARRPDDSGERVVERVKLRMRKWFKLPRADKREPFSVSHTLLEKAILEEDRKYMETLERCLRERTKKLCDQFELHANPTPETPGEALARKDFEAFFERHNSEITDLSEIGERIAEAGETERR